MYGSNEKMQGKLKPLSLELMSVCIHIGVYICIVHGK